MFVLSCHPLAESGGVFVLWESPGKGGEIWAGSRWNNWKKLDKLEEAGTKKEGTPAFRRR